MRVLWVAFACAPGRGSEPGYGWAPVPHLAPHVGSITILTASHNRTSIEAGLVLPDNVEVEYVAAPSLPGEVGHRLSYLVWLHRALRRARELHRRQPFDVVHHVTYAMSWLPPLPGRLGTPVIWTAGNTLGAPLGLLRGGSLKGVVSEVMRNCVVRAGWEVSRRLVRADMVILGHACSEGGVRPFFMPALAYEEVGLIRRREKQDRRRFRVVSAGRLLVWKGFHLGLRAFAAAAGRDWEYLVIGSGPEEERLRRLAEALGVADRVRLVGWLPRERVLEELACADVFLFPSLHDSFGWVVLEAMAAGLPVVCLDRGGPSLAVDDAVGIKVVGKSFREVVEGLAAALRRLAEDGELRVRMGEEGRRRVLERHMWDVRAREIAGLYEEVLGRRARAERGNVGPREVTVGWRGGPGGG